MVLTLFSIPKAFRKHAKVVQINALESWIRLDPRPRIMLFSKDVGVADAAKKYGCEHYGVRTEQGVPLVNYAFERAQQKATTRLMCFANADMIFLDDFMPNVAKVADRFSEFLIIGQKTDLMIKKSLDFSGDWQSSLRERAEKDGVLHSPHGLDWFVFSKWLYKDIPPFAIGRRGWDNWLMWHILRCQIPVVDATAAILAVHQMNLRAKPATDSLIRRNLELAGHAGRWGRTTYASWELVGGELRRR